MNENSTESTEIFLLFFGIGFCVMLGLLIAPSIIFNLILRSHLPVIQQQLAIHRDQRHAAFTLASQHRPGSSPTFPPSSPSPDALSSTIPAPSSPALPSAPGPLGLAKFRFCPRCHVLNEDGANYCSRCEARF